MQTSTRCIRVTRIPAPGETVLSSGFTTALGGKGQNQAVAAARAGASTAFIAAVGSDAFAAAMREGLAADGIDTALVRTQRGPSGTALIAVDDSGENTIIVEPGANALLTGLTAQDRSAIASAAVLMMQLEIPLDTVVEAAEAAAATDTRVLLNAAPIRDLPDALLAALDILVVNEHEAAHLRASRAGVSLTDLVPVVVVPWGRGARAAAAGCRRGAGSAAPVRAVDATGQATRSAGRSRPRWPRAVARTGRAFRRGRRFDVGGEGRCGAFDSNARDDDERLASTTTA